MPDGKHGERWGGWWYPEWEEWLKEVKDVGVLPSLWKAQRQLLGYPVEPTWSQRRRKPQPVEKAWRAQPPPRVTPEPHFEEEWYQSPEYWGREAAKRATEKQGTPLEQARIENIIKSLQGKMSPISSLRHVPYEEYTPEQKRLYAQQLQDAWLQSEMGTGTEQMQKARAAYELAKQQRQALGISPLAGQHEASWWSTPQQIITGYETPSSTSPAGVWSQEPSIPVYTPQTPNEALIAAGGGGAVGTGGAPGKYWDDMARRLWLPGQIQQEILGAEEISKLYYNAMTRGGTQNFPEVNPSSEPWGQIQWLEAQPWYQKRKEEYTSKIIQDCGLELWLDYQKAIKGQDFPASKKTGQFLTFARWLSETPEAQYMLSERQREQAKAIASGSRGRWEVPRQ